MNNPMNRYISASQIQRINARYSERLRLHGNSPVSLGWSDRCQQQLRFKRFLDVINRHQEPYTILDIGCGFGDFATFLENSKMLPTSYTGLDINIDLLEVARTKSYAFPSRFYCTNILDYSDFRGIGELSSFSFAMAAGILNYNFHDSPKKMHEFAFAMIDKMLSLCTKCVIIDFIPDNRIDYYEPEPYIALYSVSQILSYLTDKGLMFSLDMSQKPNPMQEALLIINVPDSFG